MPYQHMLIDGRNAIYRAIYAGLGGDNPSQTDFMVIFFRFISSYIHRFQPNEIHFMWDTPREKLWRKGIMNDYKEGRDNSMGGRYSQEEVDKMVVLYTTVCQELAPVLNCRNYQRDRQEADDLIFAFCRLNHAKTVIISSDGDFKQIAYLFSHVDVYNPLAKVDAIYQVDHIEPDPVEIKCFTGEKSDNIRGYFGIGPVKAKQLAIDPVRKLEFFKIHDEEIYLRNRALIDLTLCPYMLHNITYIMEVLAEEPTFDIQRIREIIQKYKVRGLMGEINRILLPFKFIRKQEEK